jgi:hypothetical protein
MTDIMDIQIVIDNYVDERVTSKTSAQQVRDAEKRKIIRLLRNVFKYHSGHTYSFKCALFNELGVRP